MSLLEGGLLAGATGVDRLGSGLRVRVVASDDGLVEAFSATPGGAFAKPPGARRAAKATFVANASGFGARPLHSRELGIGSGHLCWRLAMASLALPTGDPFSIVVTSDRNAQSPVWKSLLNWPRLGDAHIDYAADTPAQRNLWAAKLDEAVRRAEKPVLLVANGESCLAAVWWARLSPASYVARVAGALLFAPLPREVPGVTDKFASPRTALPFPSAIVGRAQIPEADHPRLAALAEGWGSGFLDAGWDALEAPGAGAWHQAQGALARLTARLVERRMRAAEALGVFP
ncbi:alpha/beta hydrolase [Sphingomonas hengshuiensis]|uniref:alpha/beta hydrolase n=1 Tax=Sphingomonas hengshuiensis TaxID=1609977 RepID=UPI001D10D3D7|nr:alpha/beta hydrolase [Sphingomonas hengshuiensis]